MVSVGENAEPIEFARNANVEALLSNSFGLGGQNATLVLGRYKTNDK